MTNLATQKLSEVELAEYFQAHADQLMAHARQHTRSFADAEDAVSEIFLATLQAIHAGKGPNRGSEAAYFNTSIRNFARRHSSRQSKEITHDSPVEQSESSLPLAPNLHSSQTWDDELARQAFAELPEHKQFLLHSATISGKTPRQIAATIGKNTASVRVSLHRARAALKTKYLALSLRGSTLCGNYTAEQLARFHLRSLNGITTRNLRLHLPECVSCTSAVAELAELRVPVSVIVGIAVLTGGSSVFTAPQRGAHAAINQPQVPGRNHLLAHVVRNNVARVALVVVVAVAGLLVVLPVGTSDVTEDGLEQTSAPFTEGNTEPGVIPSEEAHSNGDGMDSSREGVSERITPDSTLPDGVRSLRWEDPPDTYLRGISGARLLLAVEFEPGNDPGRYRVEITPPPGVTLSSASAGCTVTHTVTFCEPNDVLTQADLFMWKIYASPDGTGPASLPSTRIYSLS